MDVESANDVDIMNCKSHENPTTSMEINLNNQKEIEKNNKQHDERSEINNEDEIKINFNLKEESNIEHSVNDKGKEFSVEINGNLPKRNENIRIDIIENDDKHYLTNKSNEIETSVYPLSTKINFKEYLRNHESDVPDININIDMDEVANNAVFTVKMPKGGKIKEPLNIKIMLFLDEKNLEESTLLASINTKRLGTKMLFTDVNSDLENGDIRRRDFRYQLPKFKLPTFGSKSKSYDVETDMKATEGDLDVDDNSKRSGFRFKLPKINFSSFRRKSNSLDANGDVEIAVNVEATESSPDDGLTEENKPKRRDFRYQLPTIEFPSFGTKSKSVNAEGDVETDLNVPEGELDADNKAKRTDFRFNLPKINFPSFRRKSNSLDANGDVEIAVNVEATESSPDDGLTEENKPKRRDFRYQLPSIEFPSFGAKSKSVNAEGDSYDASGVEEDKDDLNQSSRESRHDFRFLFPKIEFLNFGAKGQSNADCQNEIEDNNLITATDVETEESGPKDSKQRHDFRYKLPKIELPSFDIKGRFSKTNKTSDDELYVDGDIHQYDFTLSFPESKFTSVEGKIQFSKDSTENITDKNHFSILFDGGDLDTKDILQINLKNGCLSCNEFYEGTWLSEINCTVTCFTPKRNILTAILYTEDSRVEVLFNGEMMIKYNLEGCITSLQRFDIEGSKLISVKTHIPLDS